jgi:hypothetical protein
MICLRAWGSERLSRSTFLRASSSSSWVVAIPRSAVTRISSSSSNSSPSISFLPRNSSSILVVNDSRVLDSRSDNRLNRETGLSLLSGTFAAVCSVEASVGDWSGSCSARAAGSAAGIKAGPESCGGAAGFGLDDSSSAVWSSMGSGWTAAGISSGCCFIFLLNQPSIGYPVFLIGPPRTDAGSSPRSEIRSPEIAVNFSYYGFFLDNAIKSRFFEFMCTHYGHKSGIDSVLKMIAISGCSITLVELICVNVNKCENG